MSDLKIQGVVEMSAEKAEGVLDRLGDRAEKMAEKTGAAAKKAGDAVDGIGSGAGASADKLTRAEGRMVESIKRVQTQMDLAGKTASQKFEFNIAAKGLDASKFEPMLAKMRETEIAQAKLAAGSVGLSAKMSDLARYALSAGAAFATWSSLKAVTASMIEAQQSAQKLRNSLEYAAGGATGAAVEISYLREVTNRLGLDFDTSSQAYAKFAAATKGSGVSLSQTKVVFEGIAAASAKLGLSADETQGALLALSQMASKGTVSAEELRGQLGERLPGAFNIAAKSVGVTTAELGKMLETGQLMASDFLPKFGQALKDNFQAPLNSLTQELNRFSSAWTLWKQELSDGANGGGFKWLTNGLNESTAAMRALGAEAGITQRILMAVGGFQAGAVGANKYDTVAIQTQKFAELKKVRAEIVALQEAEERGEIRLSKTSRNRVDVLKDEEKAIRTTLVELAARRGKETGASVPDLAGEYAVQQKKQADLLKAYTTSTTGDTKAERVAAAVEKENAAFSAAVASFSETDKRYQSALAIHNARVAELKKQPETAGVKNDVSQQYAASLAAEKDFAAAQVKIIKSRIADGVLSEEDGIKEVLAAQIAGYTKERDLLTAQLAKTSDLGDKAKIGQRLSAVGNDMQVSAAEYVSALAKIEKARTQYMQGQTTGADNTAYKIEAENAALRAQIDALGMTDTQLGEYEAAKVRVAAAASYLDAANLREAASQMEAAGIVSDAIPYYRQLADAREAAGKALDTQSLLEAEKGMKKAAVDAANEWKKTSDKIGDSITDALMRGFESGKGFAEALRDTVVNMFKTMVLKPVIQATVVSGLSAVGLGSSNALASTGSTASSLGNVASLANSAWGAYTGGIGSAYGAVASSGVGSALGLSTQMAAGYAAPVYGAGGTLLSAGSGTAAGGLTAAGSAIGAAIPYVGAAIAVAALVSSLLKKGGGAKTEGDAYASLSASGSSTFNPTDATGDNYITGGGSDAAVKSLLEPVGTSIASLLKSIGGSSAGIGLSLGFSTDTKGTAKDNIQSGVTNAAGEYVYRSGRNAERGTYQTEMSLEVQRMMVAAVRAADVAQIYKDVTNGIDLATASAETLSQTLSDVSSVTALRTAFDNLNFGADTLSTTIISAAGGISSLSSSLDSYYGNYFTEAERTKKQADAVSKAFADMGIALPTSKDAFRALTEQVMATGDAGADTFAKLMGLQDAFATVADAATEAANTAAAAAKSSADAIKSSFLSLYDTLTSVLSSATSSSGPTISSRNYALGSLDYAAASVQSGQSLLGFSDLITSAISELSKSAESLYSTAEDYALSQARATAVITALQANAYKNSHAEGLASVPYDGYQATLHTGEAIVDAQSVQAISRYFNAAPSVGNTERLESLVEALTEEVVNLRAEAKATAGHTNRTANALARVTPDGDALLVRITA